MRFLANENIPGLTVSALRNAGHDVTWVRTIAPGAADTDLLALAAREQRILLTFDKDFGELARHAVLPPDCGVVLLRIPMPKPGVALQLAHLLGERDDWVGHFAVVGPGTVRMRRLG